MASESISFDDLMDPDGREYQTNTDTGEIRYEGDPNPDDGGGIWNTWRDPNISSTNPFGTVQDEYKVSYSMKELHEFLNNYKSGTDRIKEYREKLARGKLLVGLGLKIGGIGVTHYTIGYLLGKEHPIGGVWIMAGGVVEIGIRTMLIVDGMRLQGH